MHAFAIPDDLEAVVPEFLDDSRITQYAEWHDLAFEWRIEPAGRASKAVMTLDGVVSIGFGLNDQAALNDATDVAIGARAEASPKLL